jgi:hypothetical protein
MMKPLASLLAAFAVLSVSGLAAAQITQQASATERARAGEPVVSSLDRPHSITFTDDPLSAALDDGNIPRIKVRAHSGFSQLSRPRVQFVTEMLKSVEVL